MKKISSAFLIAIFGASLGCQAPSNFEGNQSDLNSQDDTWASALRSKDWCLVETASGSLEDDRVMTLTFLDEGFALIKSLSRESADDSLIEDGAAAGWSLSGTLVTYRDLSSSEETQRELDWIDYEVKATPQSLWGVAMTVGSQLCLRSRDLRNPNEFEIQCPCDLTKIWEKLESDQDSPLN